MEEVPKESKTGKAFLNMRIDRILNAGYLNELIS